MVETLPAKAKHLLVEPNRAEMAVACDVYIICGYIFGYLIPGTGFLVPGTCSQVPEHLFGRSERLLGVFEHLFVSDEHCSFNAVPVINPAPNPRNHPSNPMGWGDGKGMRGWGLGSGV
jgi:hypothetical protein